MIGAVVLAIAVGAGAFFMTRSGTKKAATPPPAANEDGGDEDLPKLPPIVTLALNSAPEGATVIDTANGKTLGKTPLSFDMPGARDPRRFKFQLDKHQVKLLELIPAENIDYTVKLKEAAVGDTELAAPEVVVMPQEKIRTPRTRPRPRPRPTVVDTPKPDTPKPTVADAPKPDTPKPAVTDTPKPAVVVTPKPKPAADTPKPKPTVVTPKPKPTVVTPKPKPPVVVPKPPDEPKLKNPFGE